MARKAAGKLISGLVMGAAVGTTLALALSSRAAITTSTSGTQDSTLTSKVLAPIHELLERAHSFVHEVRTQVHLAIQEGKATAAQTRTELTTHFEAAKRGEWHREELPLSTKNIANMNEGQ